MEKTEFFNEADRVTNLVDNIVSNPATKVFDKFISKLVEPEQERFNSEQEAVERAIIVSRDLSMSNYSVVTFFDGFYWVEDSMPILINDVVIAEFDSGHRINQVEV